MLEKLHDLLDDIMDFIGGPHGYWMGATKNLRKTSRRIIRWGLPMYLNLDGSEIFIFGFWCALLAPVSFFEFHMTGTITYKEYRGSYLDALKRHLSDHLR